MSPADAASVALVLSAFAVFGAVGALLWAFITHETADSYADQAKRDRAFWAALRRQSHIKK